MAERYSRFVNRLIVGVTMALVLLSGCSTSEESVAKRSLEQAKDNLVQLSNGFFAGGGPITVRRGPLKAGCIGDLAAAHGPPFRWEYNAAVTYTPEAAAAARGVVDSMSANGWSVKVRDLKQDDSMDYTLSDGSGVLVGVTIPYSDEVPPGLPAQIIQAGGSSECAT
ncbi:MAG: hypothetical protein ABWZ02_10125 [Nakamurella sp.]